MVKCDMSEAEVIEAYNSFNAAYPDGVITLDQFVLTMKVETSLWCPGIGYF